MIYGPDTIRTSIPIQIVEEQKDVVSSLIILGKKIREQLEQTNNG